MCCFEHGRWIEIERFKAADSDIERRTTWNPFLKKPANVDFVRCKALILNSLDCLFNPIKHWASAWAGPFVFSLTLFLKNKSKCLSLVLVLF